MTPARRPWTDPSFHEEMQEFVEHWPDIWSRCRQRGIAGVPHLIKVASWVVFMVFLILCLKAYNTATFFWQRINPRGSFHRARRARKRRDEGFRHLLPKPAMRNGLDSGLSRPVSRPSSPDSSERKGDLFFSRLPFEVRRDIQILAFGNKTLHMDLQFQHPFVQVDDRSSGYTVHARILSRSLGHESHLNSMDEERWRWFGCVCHRYPYDRPNLSLGRKRGYPYTHFIEPDVDCCLQGMGKCDGYPGEWPEKCEIGIMGWLLSRRNAYIEGTAILYSANTIHIASPILHRSIQDLFPKQRLSSLTSLELVWNPEHLPLSQGFTSDRQVSPQDRPKDSVPIFPSLKYLRICFRRLVCGNVDHATGLVWPYAEGESGKSKLAERLHDHLLPTVDRLLDRIAPPSTDVILSCAKWDWYTLIDLHLVEKQGKERTKLQRADIEGLKCWREIPRAAPDASRSGRAQAQASSNKGLIEETQTKRSREGYWIHMCIEDVHLDRGMDYDWHRHELYNLGARRYRYC